MKSFQRLAALGQAKSTLSRAEGLRVLWRDDELGPCRLPPSTWPALAPMASAASGGRPDLLIDGFADRLHLSSQRVIRLEQIGDLLTSVHDRCVVAAPQG